MMERMAFVRAVESDEDSMSALCARFGISRKTGYKWLERFAVNGESGLEERSRAPHSQPNRMPEVVEQAIIAWRKKKPSYGPKKLAYELAKEFPALQLPSLTSIANVLKRHGLSKPRKRRGHATPSTTPLADATHCNVIWSIDFKGWFRSGDGQRVVPLTMTDACSRFLLCLQVMGGKTDTPHVQTVMRNIFLEYGLPERIRSDNGAPFASTGLGGLSRLSVWWIQLGIVPERIEPGCPQQNGRHERFHLTLAQETAMPPAASLRAQQQRFRRFHREYNEQRPHEALGQIPPAEVHQPSPRPFPQRIEPTVYPDDMETRRVRGAGQMKWSGKDVLVSGALCGQTVGLDPIDDGIWAVHYRFVKLGIFDERTMRITPENTRKRGKYK